MAQMSELMTGVAALENERRDVEARVGALLEENGADQADELPILVFARRRIIERFGVEEELMWRTSYPDVLKHKEEHDKLAAYVASLTEEIDEIGLDPDMVAVANRLLGNWLLAHVNTHDRALSKYLTRLARS
jgi:hemerythrin-like metal-binding protein